MNFSKILFSASVGFAISTNFLMGGDAVAGTLITSTVYGSDTFTPTTATGVQDGDFWIRSHNLTGPTYLGDGLDEVIEWDFDFSNNLYLDQFRAEIGSGLKQALLTFDLTPIHRKVRTDDTFISEIVEGDILVNNSDLPNVFLDLKSRLGQRTTLTFKLLGDNLIDESALLEAFEPDNKISWIWGDDVIMHSATLTLETRDVPEPATILGLLVLGTVGASAIKRKKETI